MRLDLTDGWLKVFRLPVFIVRRSKSARCMPSSQRNFTQFYVVPLSFNDFCVFSCVFVSTFNLRRSQRRSVSLDESMRCAAPVYSKTAGVHSKTAGAARRQKYRWLQVGKNTHPVYLACTIQWVVGHALGSNLNDGWLKVFRLPVFHCPSVQIGPVHAFFAAQFYVVPLLNLVGSRANWSQNTIT